MTIQTIATTVHGRFFREDRATERLIVGFHGYAEVAEAHLAELQKIAGIERWSVVSVQALHPFYTRAGQVVASWMTSVDRELAIADNLAYVRGVLAALPPATRLVFSGFSQGAAMAARAAAGNACHGLMILGGDIPPEVKSRADVVMPPVLVGRGTRDEWYTEEKFKSDLEFLEARTRVTRCVFDGGHEWSDAYRAAASEFLKDR